MSLDLSGISFTDPTSWAEVIWLKRHITHIRHLHVVICQVRSAVGLPEVSIYPHTYAIRKACPDHNWAVEISGVFMLA